MRRAQPLLGTFVTISVWAPERAAANRAIDAAFNEVRRVDASMSIHRPESELSLLNARAANESVSVSSNLFAVISKAQEISDETEGSFDITIRPLVELWGFVWRNYQVPTEDDLKAVLPRVNYRLVELNRERRTVRFKAPGVSIDLGGIAKGYAVDCALERLRQLGFTNAMVKAGGDLRVIGAPPGNDDWTVQLEDPRKRGARIAVSLRDAALSTSGNYENFFEADGKRYSHILNPRTGMPTQGIAACTVIASTCTESDALATACFVYGVEKSLSHIGKRYSIRFTLTPGTPKGRELTVVQTRLFPARPDAANGIGYKRVDRR